MDIIQHQITQKWYKIELYLQWQTDRSGLLNSAVFTDPQHWLQRHAVMVIRLLLTSLKWPNTLTAC